MSFQQVPNKIDFIAQEHDVLAFWKESDAFQKGWDLRKGMPTWSFMDGPITANNPMGVHHGWGRTFKDLYNRYWTMRGRELRYQNGFDCQGLWVEVEVEKELGFKSKKDIEAYGLDKFVLKCKERVLRYASVQTGQSMRLGYWMDWNSPEQLNFLADKLAEDATQEITVEGPNGPVTDTVENVVGRLGLPEMGGSYFTFSNENNYMIWTFLKKCWEKGWLYRGADVMPWCPRCATGISQHEIVTDGYADITHQSVTVRFPLRGRENESLLVWTTTPWTLTSNVAAAVGPELTYVKVKNGDEIVYLSKGTLAMLRGDHEILDELKGKEMVGWAYDGPFDDLDAAQMAGGRTDLKKLTEGLTINAKEAHRIIAWEDVGESEGTGIVHIAPGCGAEDFRLGKENGLPFIAPLEDEGHYIDGFGWLTGKHVSEVADLIFEDLEKKGVLYHVEPYTHRYPTCWRCKTELVFRLVDEWFISMGEWHDKPREEVTEAEKAESVRYQIMDVVDQIRWVPEFGHARELDWLRNMHDWMISKKRFWGLALPIWVCQSCDHFEVIGSDDELAERAVEGLETFQGHTPHRPFVDAVKIDCPQCSSQMSRIPDVGNPWLDAGIVSFSTLAYRKDPDYWAKWFPADWISESFPGQFRNWFYSLLTMGTVLAEEPPFRNLFGYATLIAEDGREMHKSWGNSIEFNEAADKMGVDVMRWLYCAHKPENNLRFGYGRSDEVRRQFLIPLWNAYSFFATYAELDQWQPDPENFDPTTPEGATPQSENALDQWILARLNQVVARVHTSLENYDAFASTLAVEPFVDDLTNWFIRRSRRRFWRGEHDADKQSAYATLYHILVKLTRLIAPITPFVTEVIYQNLVKGIYSDAYDSVHHTTYPMADEAALNDTLVEQMALARRVVSLGLSARGDAGLKVRQPLAQVVVSSRSPEEHSQLRHLEEIVLDELNVKGIEFVSAASDLVDVTVFPFPKQLGQKYGRGYPLIRKALSEMDQMALAAQFRSGETVQLHINGEDYAIEPGDVEVRSASRSGYSVAEEAGYLVAVTTELTPALKQEGNAREFVRHVQQLRKDTDFEISDRISIHVRGADEGEAETETGVGQAEATALRETREAYSASMLSGLIANFGDYIREETLTVNLVVEQPIPAELPSTSFKLGDAMVTVAIRKEQAGS